MYRYSWAISTLALIFLASGWETAGNIVPRKKSKNRELRIAERVGEKNIDGAWQGKSVPHLKYGGYSTSLDLLYWRADEDGLEYVAATDGSTSKFHPPKSAWDPGFRIGFGYTFENEDFWTLFLNWTYFHTHQEGSRRGTLTPVWAPSVLGQLAVHTSVEWKLLYQTWDLSLGRDYFICRTITLRPHAGLRGALIHQHYSARYRAHLSRTELKAENRFGGIGVRAGADLCWYFTPHWAAVGSFAGALLYGHFDLDEKLEAPTTDHLKEEFSRVAPNLEARAGLQWETYFSKRYRFSVCAAYEFSEWFSQNRLRQVTVFDNSSSGQVGVTEFKEVGGNLGLQGVTLGFRLDF